MDAERYMMQAHDPNAVRTNHPSLTPLAADYDEEPDPREARRKRLVRIVASVVMTAVAILVLGLLRRGLESDVAASAGATTIPLVPLAEPAAAKPAIPTIAVDALPASTQGTIVHTSKRRLIVDGSVIQSARLTVSCGKHTVKVAWGKARVVDVPCGGEVAIR
jgi:hypothetical protein